MSFHPASWHERQLSHVRECLAEADKVHTEQELADAREALHQPATSIQLGLFHVVSREAVSHA